MPVPPMKLDLFGQECDLSLESLCGKREENQDSAAWLFRNEEGTVGECTEGFDIKGSKGSPLFLGIVCDGMGGLDSGKEAGRLIAREILGWSTYADYGTLDEYVLYFGRALESAEKMLMQYYFNSGTTVSAVIGTSEGWVSLHVGDSRLYLTESGRRIFRTSDHTVVEDLFIEGDIDEDDMNVHPFAGRLRSYIGGGHAGRLERDMLGQWDTLTLCTDGAFGYMPVSDFTELIAGDADAHDIVQIAYRRGSSDNISVIRVKKPKLE